MLIETTYHPTHVNLYDKYMYYVLFTSNIGLFGEIMYNYYMDLIVVAGIILFMGMIGVIVLTVGLEREYRGTQQRVENTGMERVVESNIVWENINVITKQRVPEGEWEPDIRKIPVIPYLHMPKWIKRIMIKHVKED